MESQTIDKHCIAPHVFGGFDSYLAYNAPPAVKATQSQFKSKYGDVFIPDLAFKERMNLNIEKNSSAEWLITEGWTSPSALTRETAKRLSEHLSMGFCQIQPHITVSPEGEIVMEWWKENKKITLYILEEQFQIIRSWGMDTETEMDEMNFSHILGIDIPMKWLMN